MFEDLPALDAPIGHVTVYRQGAVVQRTATVSGDACAVRITGLPLCLDDASVVARITGAGAPVVTDVRVALEVTDRAAPDPPEKQAVDAARLAEGHAEAQMAALQRQAKDLGALGSPDQPQGKRGAAPPSVPLAARLALLDFQHARLGRVQDDLVAAVLDLQTARETRQKLEHDLQTATTARQPRAQELRKAAHLTLLGGAGEGPWTVELEYRVPGARWTPSYALRFDAKLDRVLVELRAAVAQRTGEDWRGVKLTVSTALPLSWTELPELPALRIGKRQLRPPRTGWRDAPQGADALYADYRAAVRKRPPPPRSAPLPPLPASPQPLRGPVQGGAPVGGLAMDEEAHFAVEEAAAPPLKAKKKRSRRRSAKRAGVAPPSLAVEMSMSHAPAPMASSASVAKRMGAGGGSGGTHGRPVAPPPTELVASADLLDYGRLRLSGPDASRPGQLRPVGALQLYQESVTVERITINLSVLTRVEAAARGADLSSLSLPPGHTQPSPIRDFDHAWTAAHPIDLDSDGAWHTLRLQGGEASARRRYVAVPREATDVFRTAAFDNPLSTPLPTGPADVFVGGELLLTAPLRATDRGGTVRLGLGVEEGIKLARNTRFAERTTGLLSSALVLAHEVDIDVANNLSAAAEVEVRERLPVHRDDDDGIEVTDVHAEPAWQVWEQEDRPVRGTHRWVVQVPANHTHQLKLRYAVEISSKEELVGGNRRET